MKVSDIKITRYDFHTCDDEECSADCEVYKDGDYVIYDDYEEVVERLLARIQELEKT